MRLPGLGIVLAKGRDFNGRLLGFRRREREDFSRKSYSLGSTISSSLSNLLTRIINILI